MAINETIKIKAIENGPLQVSGDINLIGIDGNKIETNGDVFLCRCGQSNNKPFCDGSHKKKGFKD